MPRPGAGGPEVYTQVAAPIRPAVGDLWNDGAGNLRVWTQTGWDPREGVAATVSQALSVLSDKISVLSQALSVLSQATSVADAALSVRVDTQSQSISVLSQGLSVVSQALSVLSQATSVADAALSVRIDTQSQAVSVLSQAVSVISQQVSVLSQQVSTLSQAVSVISAGLGGVQLKVASNAQVISGTATVAISALSAVVTSAAVYQIDATVVFNMSVANGIIFNLSGPVSATIAGKFQVGTGVSSLSTENFQAFPATISVLPSTTSIFTCKLDGVLRTSATAGTLQLYALASAAGADINIRRGSYFRAYKIG